MSIYQITPRKDNKPAVEDSGFRNLRGIQRDIDSVFDNFFRGFALAPSPADFKASDFLAPNLDISETDKAYSLELEMPGVDEKDVDVSLADGVLTIKGEKKSEETQEDKNYLRVERNYGTFQRSISVPENVNADKIEAKLKNGVLSVSIPKKETKKPEVKKITVKGN